MIDPKQVCLYIPDGLKKFKLALFERIAGKIQAAGGTICRGNPKQLDESPRIPIVGCSPELKFYIQQWRKNNRTWIYWDRGYARRVFATWLPKGENGGYYRWHLNSFQMQKIIERPADRWDALNVKVEEWRRHPEGHIVVALLTPTYEKFHGLEGWADRTLRALALITKRQIVVRDKETKRPLQADLNGAFCLITHASMTAVESVISGCPVVCDVDSAASLMGINDIHYLENVKFPDRTKWLHALAYTQFNEQELVDGTLWRMIDG